MMGRYKQKSFSGSCWLTREEPEVHIMSWSGVWSGFPSHLRWFGNRHKDTPVQGSDKRAPTDRSSHPILGIFTVRKCSCILHIVHVIALCKSNCHRKPLQRIASHKTRHRRTRKRQSLISSVRRSSVFMALGYWFRKGKPLTEFE